MKTVGSIFDTDVKKGQGQDRIITLISFVGPECPMLYKKFQGHWPYGSDKKVFFFCFFFIYGYSGHFGHFFFLYMDTAAILIMWP